MPHLRIPLLPHFHHTQTIGATTVDMAAAVSPQEMALYLTGCTQEQRDQFNEMLQQINSQASSLNMGTTLVHSGVTKNTKRKGKLTKADLASIGPPKRPLNSWMGFRNFYIPLMLGVPQKCVSKTMTMLWSNDLFKAKWALLSKAYSVARGTRSKIDVPLSGFFALCAPLVGVIPPQDYLGMLGWQMTAPRPGETVSFVILNFVAFQTDLIPDAMPPPHLHPRFRSVLPAHQVHHTHRGRSRQDLLRRRLRRRGRRLLARHERSGFSHHGVQARHHRGRCPEGLQADSRPTGPQDAR
uniref:Mating-type protein MAT-1 n=1 Tax=Zymoseptoria tritici TaxID=1047171 RepID=E9JPX1_ZYMTR|nr:mating type 1-1 protein [Zymoseptoria tritici]